MKASSLIRDPNPLEPVTATQPARHTGLIAIRFAVPADTREECVQGLEQLLQLDLVPLMLPVQVRTDGWMARAVPRPTAPANDGQGQSGSATR